MCSTPAMAANSLTLRAAAVSTPSVHSRVSRLRLPSSCWRGMALGFTRCTAGRWPSLSSASSSTWGTQHVTCMRQQGRPRAWRTCRLARSASTARQCVQAHKWAETHRCAPHLPQSRLAAAARPHDDHADALLARQLQLQHALDLLRRQRQAQACARLLQRCLQVWVAGVRDGRACGRGSHTPGRVWPRGWCQAGVYQAPVRS